MPIEVVLLFDNGGVITSSPEPAARRLAEFHMQLVFERAARSVSLAVEGASSVATAPATLASKYAHIYWLVSQFTKRVVGNTSAWNKLMTGVIRRNEFITAFHDELVTCLKVLAVKAGNQSEMMEALSSMNLKRPNEVADWKRKHPHLCIPQVQALMLQILDPESFLCVLEKVSARRNVLNMMHYLRTKTFQEIKLGVVTNNWEAEGSYVRTMTNIQQSGGPQFISLSCPIEYGDHGGSFDVNGLFDVVAQSYLLGKEKPGPEIFEAAVESVLGRQRFRDTTEKPLIFFFDDLKANCDAATKLKSKPFHSAYHIANGPWDVYHCVHKALSVAAAKDPYWKKIVEGLEQDIAPLFPNYVPQAGGGAVVSTPRGAAVMPAEILVQQQQQQATSTESTTTKRPLTWVQAEFHNLDNNLLFLPPPPNPTLEPLEEVKGPNFLDLEERNRMLHFLARNCPQYFPFHVKERFEDCSNLSEEGSFATSSGPVVFEMFRGGMSNPTYRFTCRTGSFVIRKQPRGRILKGAHDMRREYEIMRHLSLNSKVPVPKCLAFCDDPAVCQQSWYVMRYRDGRMVYRIAELAAPPFSRPFSQSRVLAKTTLNPRLFFKEAVNTLVLLHQAPIPKFLQRSPTSSAAATNIKIHPLLRSVQVWDKQYQRGMASLTSKEAQERVQCPAFEFLSEGMQMLFHHSGDGNEIPMPEKQCLTHGDYKIDNLMFTHRSMEGRSKYPPKIILLLDFELAQVGDPLADVAYLCLFHYFPAPKGIQQLEASLKGRYPQPEEILEYYCQRAQYMTSVPVATRNKVLLVYMAAMCHKLAGIAHGVVVRGMQGNATDTAGALKLSRAVDHLSRVGCGLLGLSPPGGTPLSKM